MKQVLRQMVEKGRIMFLERGTKEEAIRELVEIMAKSPKISDREDLISSLLEREEIMSTGIGYGIAVPHVKIRSVKDLIMAMGIHKNGIDWGTIIDNEPVKIVVLIAAPDYKTKGYLKVMRRVMKILKNDETRKKIESAETLEDIHNFFL